MLFGGAVAGESFFQRFEVRHLVYVDHAPVGEASGAALSSDLVGQKAGSSVSHSVVVWLCDSWFALIGKKRFGGGC